LKQPTFLLVLLALFHSCSSAPQLIEAFGVDEKTPTALKPSQFLQLDEAIEAIPEHKIRGVVVAQGGEVIYEEYFNGFTAETPVDIRSATKSITSLLVGIAIDQGFISDVNESISKSLGAEYPQAGSKTDITIEHLLTMSSGLDCDDSDWSTKGHEDKMYWSRDWTKYFLNLDAVDTPGSRTRYCTGGVVALGEILSLSSGLDFAVFAEEYLFNPLGIHNYQFARYDKDIKTDSGGHLLISPRGLLRIGELLLSEGSWKGNQLIAPGWIEESFSHKTAINENAYGYLWWLNALPYEGKIYKTISARGNGGNVLFIVPELEAAVVFTAGYFNSPDAGIPYELFFEYVFPQLYKQMIH
jgi:CubicO group peptidase (beta-lactamase class C family)